MSQVELLCAAAVLMVAGLGFSRALVASMHLAEATRQHTLALEAARAKLEELQDAELRDLLVLYDADPSNDPGGAGSAPGEGFTVDGLTPTPDDEDGLCGGVEFPLVDGELLETAELPEFGLPRDLDGSGDIDGIDHASDYALLPVRVVVRWRTEGAPGRVEVRSFLAQR